MSDTPRPMMTGSEIGIEFTYEDGSTSYYGSWTVPVDIMQHDVQRVGDELGWALVYEMAKQPTRTVVGARIVHRPKEPTT